METPAKQALRVWPGVVAVTLLWLLRYGVPIVAPDAAIFGMIGGLAGGTLAVLVWWLFFSRAPWSERVGVIVLMMVAIVATKSVVDVSIANGMMGRLLFVYAIPVLCLALVAGAVVSRRMSTGPRRATMIGATLLACAVFTLIRTNGVFGDGSDFAWRWTPTAEERLLAQAANEKEVVVLPPAAPVSAPASKPPAAPAAAAKTPAKSSPDPAEPATATVWPGFRGPARDGVIRGLRIETDWSRSAPVELWRRQIAPGWGSFAVHGNFVYTQEQRGDDEIVSCYNLTTGAPLWRHRDKARFWESNAGAGPRGTPALSNGSVYTFGATGILNALDARDGSVIWSRNAASDTKRKTPEWGFTSSPLVLGDMVIVATSGVLAAYDAGTGSPRWVGPASGGSYSSPHLMTLGGVAQIVLLSGVGATSVAPADGAVLWKHPWPGGSIVQPGLTADGDVLINSISMAGGVGLRRLAVAHGPSGWTVEERWTSIGLKPYFNDFVVHKGHAFGFDGSILACIDLSDGKRKWKGGRYGNGQLVLLSDQDLLLVLSDEGELALVGASPGQFTELARRPAIEGKTWNHPVLAGDVLLVRNGQEMAAFRLSLAGR